MSHDYTNMNDSTKITLKVKSVFYEVKLMLFTKCDIPSKWEPSQNQTPDGGSQQSSNVTIQSYEILYNIYSGLHMKFLLLFHDPSKLELSELTQELTKLKKSLCVMTHHLMKMSPCTEWL